MSKANIYREKGAAPKDAVEGLQKVNRIVSDLRGLVEENTEAHRLFNLLSEALASVEDKLKATVPIRLGNTPVGFAISEQEKNVAIDSAILVLRELKKIKGWR